MTLRHTATAIVLVVAALSALPLSASAAGNPPEAGVTEYQARPVATFPEWTAPKATPESVTVQRFSFSVVDAVLLTFAEPAPLQLPLAASDDAGATAASVDAAPLTAVAEPAPSPAPLSVSDAEPAPSPTMEDIITNTSLRYGLDPSRMINLARCESRLDPAARGAGGASGLFQIVPRTWAWASEQAGVAGASPLDAAANAETAAYLMVIHGAREWGCRS